MSPELLNALLKYIFPSLYISNVGASTILPAVSFIVNVLFAVYTSATKFSTLTSGFIYPFCGSSSLSSGFGSCSTSFSWFSSIFELLLSSLIILVWLSLFSVLLDSACNIPNLVNNSSYV